MEILNRRYVKGFVIATVLVSPLQYSASIVQAETGLMETNISSIKDGIYDIELIVHKDKEEAGSVAGTYFKEATLTVKDGKRFITTTIKDSQYFIDLKTEDVSNQGVFHNVKELSADYRKNEKVFQFEIGELSKKLNMRMHIIVPDLNYNKLHQVQFKAKMIGPRTESIEKEDKVSNPTTPVESKEEVRSNVVFDPYLKSEINKALGRGNLDDAVSEADLLKVRELRVYDDKNVIADYSALEKMKNVKTLSLHFSKRENGNDKGIKDLTPISKLKELQFLTVTNHPVDDLKPLKNLEKLERISFSNNEIEDISPLSELKNLKEVSVINNKLQNISPLSTMKNIEILSLANNEIKDISPLSSLGNLKSLTLSENNIENIKPIFHLSNLESLDMSGNVVRDIKGIEELGQLQSLNFTQNEIEDVSSLQTLENLSSLYLDKNNISDIRPIRNLREKTMLSLYDQKIKLDKAVAAEETKIPIYSLSGKVPKMRINKEDGTYENGMIKWTKGGEKTFKFSIKISSMHYFSGTVTQEVISKAAESKPEEGKVEEAKQEEKAAESKSEEGKVEEVKQEEKVSESKPEEGKVEGTKKEEKAAESKSEVSEVEGTKKEEKVSESKSEVSEVEGTKKEEKVAESKPNESKVERSKEEEKVLPAAGGQTNTVAQGLLAMMGAFILWISGRKLKRKEK